MPRWHVGFVRVVFVFSTIWSVSDVVCGLRLEEVVMSKRHEIPLAQSQSMFTRNAMRVHPFNGNVLTGPGGPMRGGIRL